MEGEEEEVALVVDHEGVSGALAKVEDQVGPLAEEMVARKLRT